MTLTLDEIWPLPLKDKLLTRGSQVWGQRVVFAQGEKLKVRAPSGTGKTTLLHILWQLRSDYTGNVYYDGHNAASLAAQKISVYRQQHLSVVFQDLRLFGQLTARENIELKRVMGNAPYYQEKRIDEMAERLGVAAVLHQKAAICSYGEQQRIAIIRALMQPFNWLLMDEPFSHLDADNIAKAVALIDEECEKRGAGFMLTDLDADNHFNYTQEFFL